MPPCLSQEGVGGGLSQRTSPWLTEGCLDTIDHRDHHTSSHVIIVPQAPQAPHTSSYPLEIRAHPHAFARLPMPPLPLLLVLLLSAIFHLLQSLLAHGGPFIVRDAAADRQQVERDSEEAARPH